MNNQKRPKSLLPVLFVIALGLVFISVITTIAMEGGRNNIAEGSGRLDPNVRELASLIPRNREYNRPTPFKPQDVPTSDPTVRRQARELAKAWIHTFYMRMNNYTHDFCFVLVDKEQYSIGAVTLAARAFVANGFKVSVSDSGFYYIVEITE